MAEGASTAADNADCTLPTPAADVHSGHIFGKELLDVLDDLHCPVAIMNAWDGRWVKVKWMNRRHVKVLGGGRTREQCVEEINSGGAKATNTFLKRLQFWRATVQVRHKFHDDPHKLFPKDNPPVPFYTRMLPVNMKFGDEPAGVYTMAVHLPDRSKSDSFNMRAADAFKYCTTAVSMFLLNGECVFSNSAADRFFSVENVGKNFDQSNRIKSLLALTRVETRKRASSTATSASDISVSDDSRFVSPEELGEMMKEMIDTVFAHGNTRTYRVVIGESTVQLTITGGVDPVSGSKVAILTQEDVSALIQATELSSELKKNIELNERKDMLFANLSHELKTPLNGIIALADVLATSLKDKIDDDELNSLNVIQSSGQRLSNLVTNLLDQSLLNKKKLEVHSDRPVDLSVIAREVTSLSESMAKEDVLVLNKIPGDFPHFLGDPARLTQIITNLVNNSLKFTSVGHVTITGTVAKGIVNISVEDTGIGIKQEDQERIFETLQQVDSSADRAFGGTGLGLSIAKQLCHAMGGSISVKSLLGSGSTFTVCLPFVPLANMGKMSSSDLSGIGSRRSALSSPAQSVGRLSTSPMSGTASPLPGHDEFCYLSPASAVTGKVEILSVDDERTNQVVISSILKRREYTVTKAMDGMAALDILMKRKKENSYLPDVVLLDVMMPKLNGFKTCVKIRELFPLSAMPIIMVSAKSREENIIQGLTCGANDYITKPFKKLELLARIDTQMRLAAAWQTEIEREKSDLLLRKMLPHHIMAKLKEPGHGGSISQEHEIVTILFSDIVGFTSLAASTPTSEIILMLNDMFSRFDELTEKHSVYKVETIGDAYMVAAGHMPEDMDSGSARVLAFAEDMITLIGDVYAPHGGKLQIRIGIHCGPAHSGVVGTKMPRYCFFGDTVNTASRMESTGFPSCIQVSESFVSVAGHESGNAFDKFCEYGEREVKGKGAMTTYLVKVGDWKVALEAKARESKGNIEDKKAELKKNAAMLNETFHRVKFRSMDHSSVGSTQSAVDHKLAIDAAVQVAGLEDEIREMKEEKVRKDAKIENLAGQLETAEVEVQRLKSELSIRDDNALEQVNTLRRALATAEAEVQRLKLAAKTNATHHKASTPSAMPGSPFHLSSVAAATAQSPEVAAIASVLHDSMEMMHSRSAREEEMRRKMEELRATMLGKRIADAEERARRLEQDLVSARNELASERRLLREAEQELRRAHSREVEDLRRALERERGEHAGRSRH